MNKKAFSLIEMIIVVSIIILVSVIAATVNTNLKTKTLNTRSTADLETLDNALQSYLQERKQLPDPSGNTNYFKQDTSYSEKPSASNNDVFGVYGQITSDTLPNSYLNFLPLDQFTGAFYAYGKTLNKNEFEVAGVIRESGNAKAVVKGNYSAQDGPYNLIREYNGPNFVYDSSKKYLPYNPDELSLNARITELSSGVPNYQVNQIFEAGAEIRIPQGEQATIYFGDGSKSVLGDVSSETILVLNEMAYPEDGNSLISKVSLALNAGTIWTNATQMGSNSDFSVQTGDTTAAVRGTIFGVKHTGENTQDISVVSGSVIKDSDLDNPITTENSSVGSINSEIIKGTGELTETLKTEVVSYDSSSKEVVLKMNNVFKYDADYLKVNNRTDIHPNLREWDSNETGEHSFSLSNITSNEVTLAFCKTISDTEVCTRETSVARELSYTVTDTFQAKACEGGEKEGTHGIYRYDNIEGNGRTVILIDDSLNTDGVEKYIGEIICDNGNATLTKETPKCEAGFAPNINNICERGLLACPSSYKKIVSGKEYNFNNISLSSQSTDSRTITSYNTHNINNGTFAYQVTLTCNTDGTFQETSPIAIASLCDNGYDKSRSECNPKTKTLTYSKDGFNYGNITLTYGENKNLVSAEKVNGKKKEKASTTLTLKADGTSPQVVTTQAISLVGCIDGYNQVTSTCNPKTKTLTYSKDGFNYGNVTLTYGENKNLTSAEKTNNTTHKREKASTSLTLKADGVTPQVITAQTIAFQGCANNYGPSGASCLLTIQDCSIGTLTGGKKTLTGGSYGKCTVTLTGMIAGSFTKTYDLETNNYTIKINGSPITLSQPAKIIKIKWNSLKNLTIQKTDGGLSNIYTAGNYNLNQIAITN
ncbi:FecR family protein [Candidatus Gracilibacteria bacterium]|nr:FecR family protein [Candidatus Gracilibacteria bacterium]